MESRAQAVFQRNSHWIPNQLLSNWIEGEIEIPNYKLHPKLHQAGQSDAFHEVFC